MADGPEGAGTTDLPEPGCGATLSSAFAGLWAAPTLPGLLGPITLNAGGQVFQPLSKTFFSPSFGVIADRFGVCWMVCAAPAAENAASRPHTNGVASEQPVEVTA